MEMGNKSTLRARFSKEEDKMLTEIVLMHGARRWDKIAKELVGRTGRQCRDRYLNYLSPNINKKKWTHSEDILLYRKFLEMGPKWSEMSNFFSGRTGAALKNRWNYKLSFKYSSEYVSKNAKKTTENQQININNCEPLTTNVTKDFRGIEILKNKDSELKITIEPRISDIFADFEWGEDDLIFFDDVKIK